MSTSTVTTVTPKENDWVVGDMHSRVVHAADSKRACQEWIADQHRLRNRPAGHKLADGVYQVAAVDCTYWIMAGAQTARDNGYSLPLPNVPDTFGLDVGQCALFTLQTGPALVWNRKGHVNNEPVPLVRHADADAWAEQTAGKLKGLGVTEYLGRREMRRP